MGARYLHSGIVGESKVEREREAERQKERERKGERQCVFIGLAM